MTLTAGADLDGRNPHELGDREAMGLPPRLVTRPPDRLGELHPDVARRDPDELAALMGDPTETWERRYLAGQLLGLLGDPRIRPDDPEMVIVPAGTVSIGLPWGRVDEVVRRWARYGVARDWIAKECPRHTVEIAAFRMMRYPVTNLEYRLFLERTGHWPAPTSWAFGIYPAERSNHPVWTVEAAEADAYAAWLSEVTHRRFRLPTEAEWEYAASGGTDREYPWGAEFVEDRANTAEYGPWSTTPVGAYPAGRSPWGIDDLAGNVEEFVRDGYAPYPDGEAVLDDLVERGATSYRIARGGSFSRFGDLTRCTRRHGRYPRDYYAVGFRLIEELPAPDAQPRIRAVQQPRDLHLGSTSLSRNTQSRSAGRIERHEDGGVRPTMGRTMAGIDLEPTSEQMLDVGVNAVRMLVDFLGGLDDRPVTPDLRVPSPVVSTVTDEGSCPWEVLGEAFWAAGHAVETAGPRHFGYIPGGGLFTSAVGEMLARGLNRYVSATVMAPALGAIEQQVVDWLVRVVGLPARTAGGLLTTGGSVATLSALLAARHQGLGADTSGGTLYVTEHTHHCVDKAALIAGLPASSVRIVPMTQRLSMDPDALRSTVRADRARGLRPFLVVTTAGTTNAGTVDDLDTLADVARDEGLWFHVDAAYGGFFALTARGRRLLGGLERADSVVLDPHKSMFLPYGTGAVLVRDVRTLRRAHTPDENIPAYLRDLDQGSDRHVDPADLGPERSREFRGLRMWLPLRMHGVRAFREALDEKLDLARLAHRELSADPRLQCPWSPELSTVVFRARAGDAATRALRDRVVSSGRAFCSGTQIHGRYYVRLCVLSFRTHEEHVRAALDAIRDAVPSHGASA